VAKQTAMKITDTGDGDIVGTPYYLAPSRRWKPVDARCEYTWACCSSCSLAASPTTRAPRAELPGMRVTIPGPAAARARWLQAVMEA
jgi:hypothetical protein